MAIWYNLVISLNFPFPVLPRLDGMQSLINGSDELKDAHGYHSYPYVKET
jgi:hypothetical protein